MRTDARIFRAASPLGLGRCWVGGGGCWLCGQTQTRSHPCPSGPRRQGPVWPKGKRQQGRWLGSPRGPAEAQGTPGAVAPAGGPVPLGRETVTRSCAQPLTPIPASPGAEVGPSPKPQGQTLSLRPGSPPAPPWEGTLGRQHPGKPRASHPPACGRHMSFLWGAERGRGVLAGNPERRPTEGWSPLLTPRTKS